MSLYTKLNTEQKEIWQRILLQDDALFRPSNADYYLTNTTRPNLAEEFDLVEQYLHGKLIYSGSPEAAPWCHFPARFAFVAKAVDAKLLAPEALRVCNLPFPAVEASLKAYILNTLEPVDSGQALFHVALVIEGKRFYNGSALTLNIGYGVKNPDNTLENQANRTNEVLQLMKSFFGEGEVTIKPNFFPRIAQTKDFGLQFYRIDLQPEQIYLLSLLAYETKHAVLPYNLLRANCHTYLEQLFLAILPETPKQKNGFYDYFPTFMNRQNSITFNAPLFEPTRYVASFRLQMANMARQLSWDEYQVLQTFIEKDVLPDQSSTQFSPLLRQALGKAAEQFPDRLNKSPTVLALRDAYLEESTDVPAAHLSVAPPDVSENNNNDAPIFNNKYPSAIGAQIADINGEAKLQFKLDVFNTLADQLQTAKPYGFTMGKLNLQASQHGLTFDHFMIAEENKVGAACCGATLYQLGFRKLNGISLDIVNEPELISLPEWKFHPQLELNLTKGVGTIFNNGLSMQILPSISFLSYGEYIDLSIDSRIGWTNDSFAVSISKLAKVYGPEQRRTKPNESLSVAYKISKDAHLELNYQGFKDSESIIGVGYAMAF